MALKNIFDMVKADRYTADGREAIIKAQEAETEDKVYQNGEISQKTGLMKTPNGWVKPKNGKAPGAKTGKGTTPRVAGSKATPAETSKSDNGFIDYEGAKKAIDEGKVVQWKSSDGEWHDVDPKTSTLVQARDIGVKMRVKTDAEGNPVKQKLEPSMDETRSKLLELEKRRKKFEKYPDMDDKIKLEQASLLSKAGFNSRAEFEDFVKSEMPSDAAPRVLTGDTKIRVRKETKDKTYTPESINGPREKLDI